MKLPDFHKHTLLNSLRTRMGIPPDVYGDLSRVTLIRLTADDIDIRLGSFEGIEIESTDEVQEFDDGTLIYKDRRVILFIRDHTVYTGRSIDPKFHVANCDTLKQMRVHKRHARYVVAARMDGIFKLNIIEGSRRKQELRKLNVCQNCMSMLNFDDFVMSMARPTRQALVDNFSIDRFFEIYPRNLHTIEPEHNSETAPLNDYNQDFSEKSNERRAAANWTCQSPGCTVYLGEQSHRRYLHVHHLDGMKSNDNLDNLKVLCIACHANEPNHGHMKTLRDYRQFTQRNTEQR
jgi:hypothetical protein